MSCEPRAATVTSALLPRSGAGDFIDSAAISAVGVVRHAGVPVALPPLTTIGAHTLSRPIR